MRTWLCFICTVLTAVSIAVSAEKARVSVDMHGAGQDSNRFRHGDPISLTLTLENTSGKFLAPDPPFIPVGGGKYRADKPHVLIRLMNRQGEVPTKNQKYHRGGDGWWPWYYLEPSDNTSTSDAEDAQYVPYLNPGDSISVDVNLSEVLSGCPGLQNGLEPGAYILDIQWFLWFAHERITIEEDS